MDKKELQEFREVTIMANGNGWRRVETFIKDNMKPLENRLFNEDLEKEEFKVVQAERRAYKAILDFVNRRVDEIANNQGG